MKGCPGRKKKILIFFLVFFFLFGVIDSASAATEPETAGEAIDLIFECLPEQQLLFAGKITVVDFYYVICRRGPGENYSDFIVKIGLPGAMEKLALRDVMGGKNFTRFFLTNYGRFCFASPKLRRAGQMSILTTPYAMYQLEEYFFPEEGEIWSDKKSR